MQQTLIMLLFSAFMVSIVAAHGADLRCRRRLDVITKSAWSSLPNSYFGEDLLSKADLVAVGYPYDIGSNHAVLHTTDDETFIQGNSSLFHLYGQGTTRELEELHGLRVKDIGFGGAFIVILTEDGDVWTAGQNYFGELGHSGTQDRPIFARVEGLPYVNQIAVGRSYCIALTWDAKLYSWGYNYQMTLGYQTDTKVNPFPHPIPHFITIAQGMTSPKSVCCGYKQCAALMDNNEVITWGISKRIGRPFGNGVPENVQGIPANETIIKVACGEYHTLALSQTGNLYGWGWNAGGELLQVPSEASAATKLELGGRIVRDVVAGNYITIVRTYSAEAEFFGWSDGSYYRTPTLTTGVSHPRDVMARSSKGQVTQGVVGFCA